MDPLRQSVHDPAQMAYASQQVYQQEAQPPTAVATAAGGRERHKGMVKYWLFDKGYGFASAENGQDYFIHHSAIAGVPAGSFRALNQGEEIEFELEYNEERNKYMAVNVSGPDGKPPTGPVDRNAFNENGLPNVGQHWRFTKVIKLDFSFDERAKNMEFKQWEFNYSPEAVNQQVQVPADAAAVLPQGMAHQAGALGSALPSEVDYSKHDYSHQIATDTTTDTAASGGQSTLPIITPTIGEKLNEMTQPVHERIAQEEL